MGHRLLVPPVRRMEGLARLPRLQLVDEAIAANFQAGLMPRDSLRMVRTSSTMVSRAPLPTMQTFVESGPGGANSQPNMEEGLRVRNAPRLATKTRGQGAGI